MNREPEQEKQRQGQNRDTHDRSDWIAKYLELADKILEIHMPPRPRLENES